mgnify:CR=1 FL=1
MSKRENLQRILDSGVVGVIRTEDSSKLLRVSQALKQGGVHCIEVAMTTPGALEVIDQVTERVEDVLVGAGTVLDAETARSAILAGAEYLVSPTTDKDMIAMARRYDKIVAPGAFTPTEAMTAWQAGADIIKIFPASRLGPEYLSDLKAPLPQLSLMPTGGVNEENATEFIEAGADVVCAGSALIDKEAITAGDYEVITENAEKLVAAVEAGRGN